MEIKTLWMADSRRHKGNLAGIFVLVFLVALSLVSVLAVWRNSGQYVKNEMERLGFGTITAWVSGVSEIDALTNEMNGLSGVEKTGIQSIIFSEYEVNGLESDSEGQLVTYQPEAYPYRIFSDELEGREKAAAGICPGEIYVSPSLSSMFGVEIGDEIHFLIARNGGRKAFTVKGWFEDPFMGSTMIGMKSFLICSEDHDEIAGIIKGAGINALARDGYMVHIFKDPSGELSTAQLNAWLNRDTGLLQYAEFTHSDDAIYGFMMTLQNVFTGLLAAFVLILIFVSLAVTGHSISSSQEQDMTDTGILKTIGFTTKKLQKVRMLLYLTPVLTGMAAGAAGAIPAVSAVSRMTITTTGLLIPSGIPLTVCFPALLLVFGILAGFIWLKTAQIERITPIRAIRDTDGNAGMRNGRRSPVSQRGLCFWLALRQVISGKRRYSGAGLVAMLLVFFASLIGRIDSWLGADGKGLMDAFNPADLHIAAQPMGKATTEDVERTIEAYTNITDRYMLAMPGVSVEGTDYTANVITQPERFHILQGQTCREADEIVLTEFVAADLKVRIGDVVTVSAGAGSRGYRVSGIYQCANDMGANVGLSREGYQRIGQETANMWCIHYFIENADLQPQIMAALEDAYGGDVYLHENSWPGLYGILSAMELLMYFMYGIVVITIFVITALTGGKLLAMEQRDMGIYRSLGFTAARLRSSFALRFGMVSFAGALTGILCSALLTDMLVAALLRMFGISNFSSRLTAGNALLPMLAVIGAFTVFAWLVAGRIKTGRLALLLSK
ncbi:MAG: ABC transporter permease [Lachnospiraceae bacterium]|nr:ABC transporter permease [Lachnospiraceae bacterium]